MRNQLGKIRRLSTPLLLVASLFGVSASAADRGMRAFETDYSGVVRPGTGSRISEFYCRSETGWSNRFSGNPVLWIQMTNGSTLSPANYYLWRDSGGAYGPMCVPLYSECKNSAGRFAVTRNTDFTLTPGTNRVECSQKSGGSFNTPWTSVTAQNLSAFGVNLSGWRVSRSQLSDVVLFDANLQGAQITASSISGHFETIDATGASFAGSALDLTAAHTRKNSTYRPNTWTRANFTGARGRISAQPGDRWDGVELYGFGAQDGPGQVSTLDLVSPNLGTSGIGIGNSKTVGSRFLGVSAVNRFWAEGATLTAATFGVVNLTGANFTNTKLSYADFLPDDRSPAGVPVGIMDWISFVGADAGEGGVDLVAKSIHHANFRDIRGAWRIVVDAPAGSAPGLASANFEGSKADLRLRGDLGGFRYRGGLDTSRLELEYGRMTQVDGQGSLGLVLIGTQNGRALGLMNSNFNDSVLAELWANTQGSSFLRSRIEALRIEGTQNGFEGTALGAVSLTGHLTSNRFGGATIREFSTWNANPLETAVQIQSNSFVGATLQELRLQTGWSKQIVLTQNDFSDAVIAQSITSIGDVVIRGNNFTRARLAAENTPNPREVIDQNNFEGATIGALRAKTITANNFRNAQIQFQWHGGGRLTISGNDLTGATVSGSIYCADLRGNQLENAASVRGLSVYNTTLPYSAEEARARGINVMTVTDPAFCNR